ncbi:hypothetical protein HYDPIDRAFT_25302 [Hydnomerulius pinastri MD-312]|nr:hypothetical protein HYDPIDRAFT_25302 [Hydnomerulius pinastri MD-312]
MSQGRVEARSPNSNRRSRSCGATTRTCVMKDFPLQRQTSIPPPDKSQLSSDDSHVPSWGRRPSSDFPISPVSAYSCTESWSGSSNTQEQPSPRTPEFGPLPATTIVRPYETPITAFLSQFYDTNSSPNGVYSRLSVGEEAERLGFFDHRKEEKIRLMQQTADLELSQMLDVRSPVRADDHSTIRTSPTNVKNKTALHPPLPDTRKARRFARNFVGEGLSQPSPSRGSAQRPDLSRSLESSQTSATSEEHDMSLSLASISAPSSTRPLALKFPSPPPISRTIGLLSETETKKVQEFLRDWCERENRRDRPDDSSPPIRDSAPEVPAGCKARESDEFSWEAKDSDSEHANSPGDTTRCSALIHEVSLMVGLPSEEDQPLLDDSPPGSPAPVLVEPGSKDLLVRSSGTADSPSAWKPPLPPKATQSQYPSPRRPRNIRLPVSDVIKHRPRPINVLFSPGDDPTHRGVDPHVDYPGVVEKCGSSEETPMSSSRLPPTLPRSPQKSLSVRRQPATTPIPRHKSAEAMRPSLSARKRQGQVFHLGESISLRPSSSAADMNEAFIRPREPAPEPMPPPAKRISALDRLESSLVKLKSHSPSHHHKSQSDAPEGAERSSGDLAKLREKRPSLPSLLRPQKQRSSQDLSQRHVARSARGRHFSSPVVPASGSTWTIPEDSIDSPSGAAPLNSYHRCKKLAPVGSFMDMDAPTKKPPLPHRASLRTSMNKEKMKKLVKAAARMSQGVVAWGKNLAGSMKPTTTGGEASAPRST